MPLFNCANCANHNQELREMRMSNESEKQQIRKDFQSQLDKKDDLIKDLHDRLMSRDLLDMKTAKNPPSPGDITPEENPYFDLTEVPEQVSQSNIEKTLNAEN